MYGYDQGLRSCSPKSTLQKASPGRSSNHLHQTFAGNLIIREDVRSTTGSNLRSILQQTQKVHVDHLQTSDVLQLEYHPVQDEDKWKIHIIKEILSVKSNTLEVDEFNDEDLSDILNHLCSE